MLLFAAQKFDRGGDGDSALIFARASKNQSKTLLHRWLYCYFISIGFFEWNATRAVCVHPRFAYFVYSLGCISLSLINKYTNFRVITSQSKLKVMINYQLKEN